jgi:endoglucanase
MRAIALQPRSRTLVVAAAGLAVALGFLLSHSARAAPLSVHVKRNHLVGSNGQPLRLLGVNRSGPEYACIQDQGIFGGPTDKAAIAAMVAWRINAVRIPLNEDCWLGINTAPRRYSGVRYRAAISAYVARLHEAGLAVVLDLHWNAPGAAQSWSQQPMADLDHAPAFWSSVARTFRADPAVIFDLYNEPHDISWHCWLGGCRLPEGWRTAGMQTLLNAVRSTGARQPVIAAGLDWGSDLSHWLAYRPRDPAHQLVAGLHIYDFRGCGTSTCWTRNFQSTAHAVPVVATELGQRACSAPFIERFMRWADAAGVSYLGWAWAPFGCAAPALIRSWQGQPTPSGAQFRAHLLGLGGKR